FQPAVLPDRLPVTPQSTTPLLSAGTTSANAMLTAVAPTPPRKSRIVLLNTRTFLPLKASSPLTTSRHQNTCGVMSAVIAPFEASVMVLRQNGTSSWIEAGVGPLSPMTLNWLFGKSCAAAPDAIAHASVRPVHKRCRMLRSPPRSVPVIDEPSSPDACFTKHRRFATFDRAATAQK